MKGILFKNDMIKAIAEGRKTQTRRVIKHKPLTELGKPRYQVGEIVYIKEAWQIWQWFNDTGTVQIQYRIISNPAEAIRETNVESSVVSKYWEPNYCPPDNFRTPRFMPAWAARYFIKITNVRAERLQEISNDDVHAEGLAPWGDKWIGFAFLWDSINKPPYEWQSNPWVWVYEFEKAD